MSSNIVHRLRTWTSVQICFIFAAFLVYFLADGATFSFGLYVNELINEYSKSKENTVLTVSTLAAMTQSIPLLLSPLACWWTTKFGAVTTLLIGCVVSASGYILPFVIQFNKTFWVPAVGYGCLLSVGLVFCYVPAYLTVPLYFEDDRGLATGLTVSGSGIGQVALAIIVEACIIEYGWRGASLITGGLFFFMLVSVLAFRQPASASPPLPAIELTEASTTVIVTDEQQEEEDESGKHPNSRRSRRMTIAQVLPILISTVPVRTGVTIPSVEPSTARRHSINLRPRNVTISIEPSSIQPVPMTDFRRTRANTIAVPLQTMRRFDGSFERIHQPSLAPIASVEETSVEEENPPSPEHIDITEESTIEKHWLLNSRFLLFCFSNFTLCLVLGVPYVIIPTYISETFLNQGYLASWTLSNVGIASALGQILLGYLHDQKICAPWAMYTFAVIVSGVSLIILALFRYKLVVLICAFMFGLAISANYALQLLIVIDALSMDNMANAFGVLQFCQGISTLIGIPLQGLLRDISHSYKLSFLTSGFIIILSGMSMLLWPCFKSTNKKK